MQTEPPLITTVIPTYRRPALLRRAICSALAQTYPRLQVCVYDNASGDETAAVVAELAREDPRVKYHCHTVNIGMSKNFEYAVADVNTPFFSILSDDDYLLPRFYETVLEGFEKHPDAMFSAGSTISMTEHGEVTHIPMNLWERDGYFTPPEGLFVWTIQRHPYITGSLFRKEVLEKVGFLNPNLVHSDFDFEWRIVSRFPYVVSYVPCMVVIIHEHQATRTSDATTWVQSYSAMRERLVENDTLSHADRAHAEVMLRKTFADALFVAGVKTLLAGHFDQGREVVQLLFRDLGASRNGYLLLAMTASCQRSRLVWRALNGMYATLLRYQTRKSRRLLSDAQVLSTVPAKNV